MWAKIGQGPAIDWLAAVAFNHRLNVSKAFARVSPLPDQRLGNLNIAQHRRKGGRMPIAGIENQKLGHGYGLKFLRMPQNASTDAVGRRGGFPEPPGGGSAPGGSDR